MTTMRLTPLWPCPCPSATAALGSASARSVAMTGVTLTTDPPLGSGEHLPCTQSAPPPKHAQWTANAARRKAVPSRAAGRRAPRGPRMRGVEGTRSDYGRVAVILGEAVGDVGREAACLGPATRAVRV